MQYIFTSVVPPIGVALMTPAKPSSLGTNGATGSVVG